MELSGIRYVQDIDFERRTAFVRVDFNVPMSGGEITDDARIAAALPTLRQIQDQGGSLVLASHLGRPKGAKDPALSLLPAGARLAELLDAEVIFADDCVGDAVRKQARDLPGGGVLLLENLRFYKAETQGDPVFASELAAMADVYVNDAFGTAHRAHASTYTMAQHFDEKHRVAGALIEKELRFLGPLLLDAERPYVGILGGAKVSDKLSVIENLLGHIDVLLIGGAMANTFLAAQGVDVGASRVESNMFDTARGLLRSAETRRTRIILPSDHIVAPTIDAEGGDTTNDEEIGGDLAAFDIGPKTIERYRQEVARARTVFWNGPVGVFENPAFSAGTFAIAAALADAKATVVVGGGDSAAALRESGHSDEVSHVSTGGGASLEFIEGRELPGIAALRAGHKFG